MNKLTNLWSVPLDTEAEVTPVSEEMIRNHGVSLMLTFNGFESDRKFIEKHL